MKKLGLTLALLLMASTGWGQSTFLKYGPANGIQCNTGNTYADTACAIADLQPVLSTSPGLVLNGATGGAKGPGTINSPGLYVNGAAVGVGGGAVSSVGLGMSGMPCTVAGSPVTSAGTLSCTANTESANTVWAGPTTGAAASPTFRALVSADVPPINLASTSNGGVTGSLPYASLSGTPTIPTAANPSGLIGLTAVNGSATTFTRSDSTHALDQSIAPTWTGNHIWSENTNAVVGPIVVKNPSTGTGAGVFAQLQNSVDSMTWGYTGTAYAGSSLLTNGPSGEAGYFYTNQSAPISLGTAGTERVRLGAAGNVTIAAPSSGTALAVTGLTGTQAFTLASSAGAASNLAFGWNVGLSTNQWDIFSQSTDGLTIGTTGAAGMALDTNDAQRVTINSSGTVTVNAPSSGITVDIASAPAVQDLRVGGTTGIHVYANSNLPTSLGGETAFVYGAGSPVAGRLMFGDGSGWSYRIASRSGSVTKDLLTISETNGVSIAAPSSGATLALNFISGTSGFTVADGTVSGIIGTGGGQLNFGTTNATALGLASNGSTRMLLSSSGNITINAPSSGETLTLAGAVANSYALDITANAGTGVSRGAIIAGGTNSSDISLLIRNASSTTNYFEVVGDGGLVIGAPTGGDKGLGSVNMQSCFVNNVACTATTTLLKTATTSRASTTTLANDPDLVSGTLATGQYKVEGIIGFCGTTTGTQGIQWQLVSASNAWQMVMTQQIVNTTPSDGNGFTVGQTYTQGTISTACTNNVDNLFFSGTFNVAVSGTIAFQWAQNSSSANNTNVLAGSRISITKIP